MHNAARKHSQRLVLIVSTLIVWSMAAAGLNAQQWYAETQIGAAYLEVPEFQFFSLFDGTGTVVERFTTDDGQDTGLLLGGKLGRILDQPLGRADGTRLELSGFYTQTEQTTNRTITGGFVALGNRFSITFLGSSDQLTRRRIDYGGYDLLLHQDHLTADNELLTWYGGPSAVHLYQDRETGRIAPLIGKLEESLNTDYLGGKTGLTIRQELNNNWSWTLDGSLGFYGAHSRYRGTHRIFNSTSDERRSRTKFAFGTRAEFELKRRLFRNSFIGGFATFQHLNYAPHMNYGDRARAPNAQLLAIDDGELNSTLIGMRLTVFR